MNSDDRSTSPRPPVFSGCVLVVDDEVLVRLTIAAYLRECGYKVYEAASAEEAVAVLQNGTLFVDVVFTDVEMHGSMDGFGLSQWVHQHRPEIAVVLAGTAARAADAAGALCEKGPHLRKPYEPQAVLDQIKRLLASRGRRLPNA